MKTRDFYYRDAVSFMVLIPITERAETWIKNNLDLKRWQDAEAVQIEHRYFYDILDGIKSAGLTISETPKKQARRSIYITSSDKIKQAP